MKSPVYIISALAVSLFFSACSSFEKGVPQEVVVLSFPSEASVYINGIPSGVTPMELDLPRKLTHEIRLEKAGFNSSVQYFTPVGNERGKQLVRFGLSEDLGYYHDLEPAVMKAAMTSDLVPYSTGADPFARMAQQALQADRQLEAGKITPAEHKYIIEQIIVFFQ